MMAMRVDVDNQTSEAFEQGYLNVTVTWQLEVSA